MTSHLPRLLIATLLALLLSACGFHLRGALTLPVDIGPIEVVSNDPYSSLARGLALSLERQGAFAEVVQRPSGDLATLTLVSERWDSRAISIDAQGRGQEYSLRNAVIFNLRDANGQLLVPDQAIELSRDYVAPPRDAIGTSSERDLLAEELRREMVAAIIRRIDAVMKIDEPLPATQPSP